MGHATRCVPVIRKLAQNNTVILGITPLTRTILEVEFPELKKIYVPSYNIRYSNILPVWSKLLFDWPRIRRIIRAERELIERIAEDEKIDVVISDSRFGLHTKAAYSVFITHQLFLKAPFAADFAQAINKRYIKNFNEVWVPDFADLNSSLSGELSHGRHYHPNVKYIGPLSRLEPTAGVEIKYDYLLLPSGPEPHHQILANAMLAEAARFPETKFAFCSYLIKAPGTNNVSSFYDPSSDKLTQLIAESRVVVCRSGYSTLMDLHQLQKNNLILIPTPGQTEQEYLAMYWLQKSDKHVLIKKSGNLFSEH